jgi:D-beta-D-heptose 7-phosphate kinase/D-beta-D-heptose 1-phosphate adenosyltransferase
VRRFRGRHVLVVGDIMLDRFIVGTVSRISPEAPVPVVRFRHEHTRLGGAANVANNVVTLGGRVSLVGVVGADPGAQRARELLDQAGLSTAGLVEDRNRPTIEKVRVVTDRNQQVVRIDYEREADVEAAIEAKLTDRLLELGRGANVLLVSDYLKGAVTATVMSALVRLKSTTVPLLVDPKIPHFDLYAGATLVTPNSQEAEAATHRRLATDDDVRAAATEIRAKLKSDAVLITRGELGMWLSSSTTEGSIPAAGREVSDVTGAGDTVVATLALALAAGATMHEGAMLANQAAGIVVGRFGPATVTQDELLGHLGESG